MRIRRFILFFVLLLLFPVLASAQSTPALAAVLTGDQEFPGPGDPDGFGNATFTFNPDRTQITVDATFSGIGTAITGAHIHKAPPGASAGVTVGFIGAMTITNGKINATVAIDPVVADQIIANPSAYYFNIHTQQFGAGAIRGQLSSTSGTFFIGDMNGAREVPGPGHPSATGSFVISINEARDRLTYVITTTGLANISNSHIHGPNGAAGSSAGVFVGLGGAADFVNGNARGSVAITPQQAAALIANPSDFYVNVHTTELPGGAIRGQLVAGSIDPTGNTTILPVVGRIEGLGDLFVTNLRIFNASFDSAANVMLEFFPAGSTPRMMNVNIPARGTAVLNDVVGSGFGMSSGIGGARVTSTNPIVANVRIIADRRSTGGGTFGQLVPGVRPPRRGIMAQLSHDTATRTNIGIFNPNDTTVTIRLELRNAAGSVVATAVRTLPPLSHTQAPVPAIFPSVTSIADGTLTFDASAPTAVYISVIDNVTNDPLAVVGVADGAQATAP